MMHLRNWFSLCIFLIFREVSHSDARPPSRKLPYSDRTPLPYFTHVPVESITDKGIAIGNGTEDKAKIRILARGSNKPGYVAEFSDQDIVFPDSYQVIFDTSLRIEGPPKCANGGTFCEDYPNYPYRQIKDVLKQKRIRSEFFGKDETPEDENKFNITNRLGEEEEFVCASYQRTIFPKVGKNKSNKWKIIINQEEQDGFIQGVRIELCQQPDTPCSIIGELATGYTTSCKQKYIYRRLMCLTEHGDPTPDSIEIPSACCCSYKRDLGILSRFGAPITPAVPIKSKYRG